ncbi:AcvB/VirJ family lysyl-phosphatidylglycerol hydrolase, partial [Pseudomonas aeruginosa]
GKDSAEHMASMSCTVGGNDTLRYYWQQKSAEQSTDPHCKLMQH